MSKLRKFLTERETVESLNTSFLKTVGNINVAKYKNCDPFANKLSHPLLKTILKYRDYPRHHQFSMLRKIFRKTNISFHVLNGLPSGIIKIEKI